MVRSKKVPNLAKDKDEDDIVISPNKYSVLDSDVVLDRDDDEDEPIPCRVCATNVSKETDGLQCDRCDAWVHSEIECSDLTKPQFKFMKKCNNSSIQYICIVCKDYTIQTSPSEAVCRDAISKNGAKIDSIEASIKTLKEQNREIFEFMKKKSKTDDSLRLHVTEELHIQNEKKEKACNLIVYNVPESDSKVSKAQAELEDVQNVKNVFNFVCPSVDYSGLSSKTVTRCGDRREATPDFPTPKPRPIKIVLQSPSDVILIRKNARKLKDNEGLRHVGISEDKTYRERMEDKELRTELLKRRNVDKEDVVIYNRQVRLRSELPNFKNNGTGVPKVAGQHVGTGAEGNPVAKN